MNSIQYLLFCFFRIQHYYWPSFCILTQVVSLVSSSWCCFVFCRHFDCYGFLMATSYSIRGRAAKKTMTAPKSFRVVVSQKHVKIKTSHYTSYQSSVKRKQKKSNIVDVHKQTDVKMMLLESFLSFRSLVRIQYYILHSIISIYELVIVHKN